MEVSPDNSTCSRRTTRAHAKARATTPTRSPAVAKSPARSPASATTPTRSRASATIDLSDEISEAGRSIASRLPKRKRKPPAAFKDEEQKPYRWKKAEKEEVVIEEVEVEDEDEEDSKPAAVESPYPIGCKIQKEFESGFFKGKVVSGPTRVDGETVWNVVYEDGDKEQMNLKEIKQYKVAEAPVPPARLKAPPRSVAVTPAAAAAAAASPARRNPRRGKDPAFNPYTIYFQDYQTAVDDMVWRMGNTEKEVHTALKGMKPPYGLNDIQQRIHEAKESKEYVPRVKFDPKKGMRVRKYYDGAIYYGKITGKEPEWLTDDVTGDDVKMWEVTFDDGTKEDMDFNELRVCYAGRPTRTHPIRGRQLFALELFCGQGTVSQEFAELKWWVRSIDNNPKSYATDVLDIMKLRFRDIGRVPDFIWASPPCHTYSNMAGGTHRSNEPGQYEKTPEARKHNRLLAQMFAILRWAKSKNPHLIIAIENPVGLLQHMPLMKEITSTLSLYKAQVHYCAFGRDDKKPTFIWTNSWKLHASLNDFKCGEKCPYHRGVHPVGARAHGHAYNAAAIPQSLAEEVAHNVHSTFYDQRIRHTEQARLTEEEEEEFDAMMAR